MAEATHDRPPAAAARCADLTGHVCPMTFVRFKLEIDKLAPGELLEIILKAGEQIQNVPRSIKAEGHKIEGVKEEGSKFRLLVRKG
ncbi:MAG TPA: sulfurtransferase TusA family protein [Planctomycetota bacterium]|nr:sulfurtransferase TusA family protein [Planctomycetota bacterium]